MNKTNIALAGIRPTSRLHIGNYLGAVKGMIELQEKPDFKTFYMVADLHALTTPFNPATFSTGVKDVILDYLACGLDPKKSTIFIQSEIKEHTYIAFLLSSQVTVAKMLHLPTYKEKIKENPKNITMCLLNYPVLMAADILAYKATYVPVGKDQEPHMETAREIARKLNTEYGTNIPEPKTYSTTGKYIPSLTGVGKMSKSVEGSSIYLTDSKDEIVKKISKIPTDSGMGPELPNSGGVQTLLTLIENFVSKEERDKLEKDYLSVGLKYGQIKQDLAQVIYEYLQPIQLKRQELQKDSAYVQNVLKEGNNKAQEVASQTLNEIKTAFGIKLI